MGNRKHNHLPIGRIEQRSRGKTRPVPVPSISLERPVLVEDGRQDEFSNGLKRAISRRLGKGGRRWFQPLPAQSLHIAEIDEPWLEEALREGYLFHQRQEKIESLALLLQERLFQMLIGFPEEVKLDLGSVCTSTLDTNPKSGSRSIDHYVVGVPSGWKGTNKHYPIEDATNGVGALQQLANEHNLVDEVFSEVAYRANIAGVTRPLSIPLVYKKSPITPSELYSLSNGFSEEGVLPFPFTIGDPVLTLRTGELGLDIINLPVRDLGSTALRAA